MSAVLLTLLVFAAWWLIGLGLLSALRADTSELRIALTAPAQRYCRRSYSATRGWRPTISRSR
jgi:hypothetical protein